MLSWRWKSLALAAVLAWANYAVADVETLTIRTEKTAQTPEIQISITPVSAQDQAQVLSDLGEHLKENPNSAMILGITGDSDELWDTREVRELIKNKQVVSTIAQSLNDIATPTQKSKELRAKIGNKYKFLKDKKMAVLVSVVPAGAYGTLTYFMTSDYLISTAAFGTVFSVNAFQAIFTTHWLKFASLGGRGMLSVAKAASKLVGKPMGTEASASVQRFGQVGWTVAMNTAMATITMSLSGTLDSAWTLLAFGFASSHDTADQVFEEKINGSNKFFNSYFVNSRLIAASVLECVALAQVFLSGYAEVALTTASAASAVALILKPHLIKDPNSSRPTIWQKIKLKMSGYSGLFKGNHNSQSCASFLTLYPTSLSAL